MNRLRHIGKRPQDGAIFCDQRYAQMLGDSNELTVAGTALTAWGKAGEHAAGPQPAPFWVHATESRPARWCQR